MSRNFAKRLAQVEQRLAEVARREKLANCNCKEIMFFRTAERFEEEKNLPCPGHGFRDLGRIGITVVFPSAGELPEDNSKLRQLIAAYETARALHRADLELKKEDDSQEF